MTTMKPSRDTPQLLFGGLVVTLLILAFSCIRAPAQILFNNGAADLTNTTETFNADEGGLVGDIFTPNLGGTATTINFAGLYFNSNTLPTSNDFTLSLYSVSAGAPVTLISTSTLSGVSETLIGTGGLDLAYNIYEFSGTLNTPFSLNAGTEYYLGISDTTSPNEGFNLAYSAGSATSLYLGEVGYNEFESVPGNAVSFALSGSEAADTPTMPPWGLAVLALLLLLIAAKSLPERRAGV
jgi:hypothetical protein